MIKIYYFTLIILLISTKYSTIISQDNKELKTNFEMGSSLGFDFSPNGNTYGLLIDFTKPFYLNNSETISLCAGIQEDFQIHKEGGFEGTKGAALNNSIHFVFGPSFILLKKFKVNLDVKIFSGWSYKSINGKLINEELAINQSYSAKTNYLSRGLLIQTGYPIKPSLHLSVLFKTDLRRLTDGDGILDFPPKVFGVGIVKKINSQ